MAIVQALWSTVAAVAGGDRETPTPQALQIVHDVLVESGRAGDELAEWASGHTEFAEATRARYAKALARQVAALRVAVGMDGDPPASVDGMTEATTLQDGREVLRQDALLADWFETYAGLGDGSWNAAEGVRRRAAARWTHHQAGETSPDALWDDWLRHGPDGHDEYPALRGIAKLLWDAEIKEIAVQEKKAIDSKHPGLAKFVMTDVERMYFGSLHQEQVDDQEVLVGADGSRVAVLDPGMPDIPVVDAGVAANLVQSGIKKLHSLMAHRFIRWVVREAHRRHRERIPEYMFLRTRGWIDLRERVGGKSNADSTTLKEIVHALDAMRFWLPDLSSGRLISLRWRDERGPRSEPLVEITVLPPLLPNFAKQVRRRSEPIVPVVGLPPMFGARSVHGLLASLQLRVLVEMRTRAVEAVTDDGILLSAEDWLKLGHPIKKLRDSTISKAPDAWSRDGDDAPAFLQRIGHDRYALGEAHCDAWEFIKAGGQRSLKGRSGRPRKRRGQGKAGS